MLLLRDVVANATAILVNSSFAAKIVELDTGARALNIGPHAFQHVQDPGSAKDDGQVLVASFGIVDPIKQSTKILDAAEELVRDPSVTVALAGPSPQSRSRGPQGRIILTGRLSDREFDAWMNKTTIAVQLRDASNGESSGAIAGCLARGIPTIVTDLGSMSELPDDVVVKVTRDISAHDLADTIRALLDDPVRRVALSSAAQRYAGENTFDQAADRLLRAIGLDDVAHPDLEVSGVLTAPAARVV